MIKKIAITGVTGFLGSRFSDYFNRDYEVTAYSRTAMDFLSMDSINRALSDHPPEVLIHCAAVSDIGQCEKDPEQSWKVNVQGPANLAKACREYGIRMIFCSSDQVYAGGSSTEPHQEKESLTPPHHYGRQKLAAEQLCMEAQPDSLCLRLSWMYDHPRKGTQEHGNLLTAILEAGKQKKVLTYPVNDFRSITYALEVARQAEHALTAAPGIYNFGSPGNYSTYEIAQMMFDCLGETEHLIQPVENGYQSSERNLRMEMKKACEAGFTFVDVQEGIKACMKQKHS